MSAPSINCFISFASILKLGASFTISSVIPCISELALGIGISGFTNRRLTCLVPSSPIFTMAISTILSTLILIPVVSRSIKQMGLESCNDI